MSDLTERITAGDMMKIFTALLWITALPTILAAPLHSNQSRGAGANRTPQQVEVLYVDGVAPPKTLEKMYEEAVLIARVSVEVTNPAAAAAADNPLAVRRQRVRVIEVFKSDPLRTTSGLVTVIQYGGTVVLNGREVATDYSAPLLEVGQELILFLVRHNQPNEYRIAYNASGSFQITDSAVAIPSLVQRIVTDFSGISEMPVEQFRNRLRRLAR